MPRVESRLACLVALGVASEALAQTAPRPRRVDVAIEGPHRDGDAFCEAMRGDGERCRDPAGEEGDSLCGCVEPEPDDGGPAGALALAAPRGPVRGARVASVRRDVDDYVACALLVTTARGTYAAVGFASCGMPRTPRDASTRTRFLRFTAATAAGGGARLTLRGQQETSLPDMSAAGGPRGRFEVRPFTVTVTVSAEGRVVSATLVGSVTRARW